MLTDNRYFISLNNHFLELNGHFTQIKIFIFPFTNLVATTSQYFKNGFKNYANDLKY